MSENNTALEQCDALHLASEIVAAYVSNNTVKSDQLPELLREIYATVSELSSTHASFGTSGDPAVPVEKSITPDFIICLEDGKKLKMLKRYLRTHYDMSPEDYRRKWGLDADYPMVAPNYSKRRSQFAKDIGLGKAAAVAKPTQKKKRGPAKKRIAA